MGRHSLRSQIPALQKRARELPFKEWALSSGLWIDRETFNFIDFPYLEPIYDTPPNSLEDLRGYELILRKPAQAGGSIFFLMWLGIYMPLRTVMNLGYYLPDEFTTYAFSDTRYKSMMKNNPDLLQLMEDSQGHRDIGSKAIRRLGMSMILFMYTGMNQTAGREQQTMRTEAMPLDALVFDEVQGMTRGQIEKTMERVSASKLQINGKVSTPKWPEADIDEWFQESDQRHFHTDCKCSDGIDLAEEWPNCVARARDGRVYYRCPHCDTDLPQPWIGRYVKHRPQGIKPGFTWSQCISKRVMPHEMLQAFEDSHDKQNFYNRKLGRPYSNPNEIPITLELLKRIYSDQSWPASLSRRDKQTGENYMGIDHMGNLNVHVIKERLPSGFERVKHLEWTEDADPFARSVELMEEYNIRFCALEALPNFNEAFKFAKLEKLQGRVFVVEYAQAAMQGEMLRWMDRDTSDPQAIRKTSDEARNKYVVRAEQYRFMSFAMGKFQDKNITMPDPAKHPLMQKRLMHGQWREDNLAQLYAKHLTRIALISERKNEKEEKRTNRVEKIGSEDPHFSYANMCCDVAIARAYGTTRLLTSEIEHEQAAIAERQKEARANNPEMSQIRERIPSVGLIVKETCGACFNFKPDDEDDDENVNGRCGGIEWNRQRIMKADPKCQEYMERSNG